MHGKHGVAGSNPAPGLGGQSCWRRRASSSASARASIARSSRPRPSSRVVRPQSRRRPSLVRFGLAKLIGLEPRGQPTTVERGRSLGSAPMDFSLTDEQEDFVAAIRDFCSPRVRHARAARAADQRLHRGPLGRDLLEDGRPRLARRDDRRGLRRLGRRRCSTPACSWRRPRAASRRSAATRRR